MKPLLSPNSLPNIFNGKHVLVPLSFSSFWVFFLKDIRLLHYTLDQITRAHSLTHKFKKKNGRNVLKKKKYTRHFENVELELVFPRRAASPCAPSSSISGGGAKANEKKQKTAQVRAIPAMAWPKMRSDQIHQLPLKMADSFQEMGRCNRKGNDSIRSVDLH